MDREKEMTGVRDYREKINAIKENRGKEKMAKT